MVRKLILPVRRPFNRKAYLILVGLLVSAVFAILPFALTLSEASSPGSAALSLSVILLGWGVNLLLVAVLGAVGLSLASRIGLGMPFIEGWTKKEPVWGRLQGVAGVSILAGIFSAALFMGLARASAPLMEHATDLLAERYPGGEIVPPAWQGLLASFTAGITEETMFRLFGLTLLAWLGGLLFRSRTGRPAAWWLWTANILFAILFGLAHLPLASQIGMSLDVVVVTRTVLLNGVAGVVFGWLYWTFGLESAMLVHFSIDVVLHSLLPLVARQEEGPWRDVTIAAVALLLVLTVIGSICAIRRDRRRFPLSASQGSPQAPERIQLERSASGG